MNRPRVLFLVFCLVVGALVLLPLTASAAKWSAPFALGTGNKFPTTAIDANGKIHFAWWNQNANTVEYRECGLTQGSCSATETISAPGVESFYPSLAIDPDNNPNVVWEARSSDSRYAVFFRRRVGGQWQAIRRVSKPSESYSEVPDLAISANGELKVTYQSKSGGNAYVYYATSQDGENFGSSHTITAVEVGADWTAAADELTSQVEPSGKQIAGGLFPRIAVDAAGNAYVVWNVPSPYGIYFKSQKNGDWSKAVKVATGHKDQTADITVNDAGRIGIVWARGDKFDISFALFEGNKKQVQSNKVGGSNEWSLWPRIATDCAGNFHVAFQASPSPDPGHNWNVYARRYNGASWDKLVTISKASSQEQVPAIAVTDVGAIIFSDGKTVRASTTTLDGACGAVETPTPTETNEPPPSETPTPTATDPAAPTATPTATATEVAPPTPTNTDLPDPTATATLVAPGGVEHVSAEDPRIVYTGKWRQFKAKKASDRSYRRCGGVHRCRKDWSAELSFVGGSRLEWETVYANTYGKVDVYIDGVLFERMDLCRLHPNSPFPRFAKRTYLLMGDASTPHSIKIQALGEHTQCSDYRSNYVALDGFNIIR